MTTRWSLINGAAVFGTLVALIAFFGTNIRSQSIDLVSHFVLADELMRWGYVRPQDAFLGWSMPAYPPLSHWLAAVVGWPFRSALVGLATVSVIAVYVSYLLLGKLLLARGSLLAAIIFLAAFIVLRQTQAMIGWEIVTNFFYPQLVGFALYLLALGWIALRRPSSIRVAVASIVIVPFIFLTQPLAGVHFAASSLTYFAADILARWKHTRTLDYQSFGAALIVVLATVISLGLPSVRALLSYAANDGTLDFNFPQNALALPFVLCFVAAAANLMIAMIKWPDRGIDLIVGAAGVAAGSLMVIQTVILELAHGGSIYAVKKHGFMLTTLGVINLSRMLARVLPHISIFRYENLAAIVVATSATIGVLWDQSPALDVRYARAAQLFAEEFVRTSTFKEATTGAKFTTSPILSTLISVIPFHNNIDEVYHLRGRLNPKLDYLMVDSPRDDAACSVLSSISFTIVRSSCLRSVPIGTTIRFTTGANGSIYLGQGWSPEELWGVWGLDRPDLKIRLAPSDFILTAQVQAALSPARPNIDFDIVVNGHKVATWSFTSERNVGERVARLPASALHLNSDSAIEFVATSPIISPREAGISDDDRKLSIGLFWLSIKPASAG